MAVKALPPGKPGTRVSSVAILRSGGGGARHDVDEQCNEGEIRSEELRRGGELGCCSL